MFDPKMLAEMQKAMQALQNLKSGNPDLEATMKQLEALKEMGVPGIDQAIKQVQDALAQVKSQGGMEATLQTKAEKVSKAQSVATPSSPPQSSSKQVGRPGETTNNIEFTALGGSLKWVDDNHVEFGSYPQMADGGVKKILWRVLEKKNGELLLISEYILDGKQYQNKDVSFQIERTGKKEDIERARLPWEKCDLRAWLNDYFYERAFNAQEKSLIIERLCTGNGAYFHKSYKAKKLDNANLSILVDDTFERYEDYGCKDTHDRVFLLNVQEALDYFKKENYIIENTVWNANLDRDTKATDYPLNRDSGGTTVHGKPIKLLSPFDGETWSAGKNATKIKVGAKHIGSVKWWLRNIGINDITMNAANGSLHGSQVAYVAFGIIITGGTSTNNLGSIGVRPAILINDV